MFWVGIVLVEQSWCTNVKLLFGGYYAVVAIGMEVLVEQG